MAFRVEPKPLEVLVLELLNFLVPRRGLEPPCLAATASKAVVSAISPPGQITMELTASKAVVSAILPTGRQACLPIKVGSHLYTLFSIVCLFISQAI